MLPRAGIPLARQRSQACDDPQQACCVATQSKLGSVGPQPSMVGSQQVVEPALFTALCGCLRCRLSSADFDLSYRTTLLPFGGEEIEMNQSQEKKNSAKSGVAPRRARLESLLFGEASPSVVLTPIKWPEGMGE